MEQKQEQSFEEFKRAAMAMAKGIYTPVATTLADEMEKRVKDGASLGLALAACDLVIYELSRKFDMLAKLGPAVALIGPEAALDALKGGRE